MKDRYSIKVIILILFTHVLFAQNALPDQKQLGTNFGFWLDKNEIRWQEFKPVLNILSAVEIFIQRNGDPGNLIIEIRDSDNYLTGEQIIKRADIPENGWLKVSFKKELLLDPEKKYKICVYGTKSSLDKENRYYWQCSTHSDYGFGCLNCVSDQWPDFDFAFKTFGKTASSSGELESLYPQSFNLKQNYPNPFNPTTQIEYSVPREGHVLLKIYDAAGREQSVLVNEFKIAGTYIVEFKGEGLSSGLYYYQLITKERLITKKMMLLK